MACMFQKVCFMRIMAIKTLLEGHCFCMAFTSPIISLLSPIVLVSGLALVGSLVQVGLTPGYLVAANQFVVTVVV
jgi:hypothetical protein